MADSTRTTRVRRVIGALLIAGVLVGCAYAASGPIPSFFQPKTADAASTQQLLEEAKAAAVAGVIQPKFVTAPPATASSTEDLADVIPGSTPGPDTLTAQFGQQVMTDYINTGNGPNLSEDDIDSFVQQDISTLEATHQHQVAYSQANENITGSGPDALTTYAAAAETAFDNNSVTLPESGLDYFTDAVENGDQSSLSDVSIVAKEYTDIATALIAVPVPQEAAAAHLELANATAALGEDFTDMATLQSDPLRAYLGLEDYQNDSTAFTQAWTDMGKVFASDNVSLAAGQPGSHFYSTCLLANGSL